MAQFRVTLAGQDITSYVDEMSIDVKDTLGQGAGSASGSSGRATTCSFNTHLGPVATAIGAGSSVTGPRLVRQGEIKVYDITGACVFGGFVTKYNDATVKTRIYTKIEACDYWQFLDRIIVDETYENATDIFIINDLLNKYTSGYNLSKLPTSNAFTFSRIKLRNLSLQKALQKVADTTGFLMWIDGNRSIYYAAPNTAQTTPFGLSTSPDYRSTFPIDVTDVEIDDNAAVNAVTFYGGSRLTVNDFTQDLSSQANGTNTVFTLAYIPHKARDGKYHVKVNGVELLVQPTAGDGTPVDATKPYDVLINVDQKTLTFVNAPATGATVTAVYRYEAPLVVKISDQKSITFFGMVLEGRISDSSVVDTPTAVQRCKVLLLQQNYGLTTIKLTCWKAGLQAGMVLPITHPIRGLAGGYLIQEVDTKPLGGGKFAYDVTCGAWNYNLVDIISHVANLTTPADDNTDDSTANIDIRQPTDNLGVSMAFQAKSRTRGGYYARSTPLGDGHDAYPGVASITG